MRRWRGWFILIAGVTVLSGCAAGAPTVTSKPTATTESLAVSTSVLTPVIGAAPATATTPSPPTETTEPTVERSPTVRPTKTRTPKPARPTKTPTEEATERPDPPPPDDSGLSRVFERGDSGRREIALTFDAGDDRGKAEEILDTLKEYGIVASFGLTGHWAKENPDLVQRMVDEGHMLFNHTYSHRSFTGFSTSEDEAVLSRDDRQHELIETADIVREETGYELAPYFRPPYADYDDEVLEQIAEIGYWITLQYSCDSFGWNGASIDEIIDKCGNNAEPGDIVLLHVGAASLDADALPGLIDTLQAQDFTFVTCEELLQE